MKTYTADPNDHDAVAKALLEKYRDQQESDTPRVEAVIDKVMAEHPGRGFTATAMAMYYEAVHQELAPLARELERENTMLRSVNGKGFDLIDHLNRQQDFSLRTFGPGKCTDRLIDHITKELAEVAANPDDLVEWVDVILLALDGAWRAGHEPEDICRAIEAKLQLNETRNWPDWRTADPDKAIEHVKSHG